MTELGVNLAFERSKKAPMDLVSSVSDGRRPEESNKIDSRALVVVVSEEISLETKTGGSSM